MTPAQLSRQEGQEVERMWMLSSGTETLDITSGQASQHPALSPHGRTLAQGARPCRLGWEDTGTQIQERHQVGSLLPQPRLCPTAHRDWGDAGSEELPSSPVCLALVHLCSTGCGARGPRHRHSLVFPTLLIKPTRNRSVCFHLQALVSAQQIEDFLCIV